MIIVEAGKSFKPRSMYPCEVHALGGTGRIELDEDSTAYGYLASGRLAFEDFEVKTGQYFSFTRMDEGKAIEFQNSSGFIAVRKGYKGQNMLGGPLEPSGRLVYIDGCSDSILVYPPRLGDPSMNHLHFPDGILQSFHIHPSIRIGMVVGGEGHSHLSQGRQIALTEGAVFVLDERERHRFATTESEMHIVAFHPDGDFGPTDSNHPMKNRTLVTDEQ